MKYTILTTVNLFKRVVSRSLCHNNVHLCGSMLRGNRGGMGERPRCDDVQRRTSSLLFFAVVLLLVALCNPGGPYGDEIERNSNDLCLLDRRQVRSSRSKKKQEGDTNCVGDHIYPIVPRNKGDEGNERSHRVQETGLDDNLHDLSQIAHPCC